MNKRVFAWVAVGLMAAVASANADPIKISGGLVSGAQLSDGAVRAYKGIPFAKPPVGDLRWREPQPAEPWSGTLAAETHRPVCMQPDPLGGNSIFTRLFFTPFEPRSEDCLYLNVWTTAAPGDKRPVMVWIPGGGFRGGSSAGAIYDGAELAKKGVVLVSINYRLWKFGFLATSELSKESPHHVSGNYGLLDQIAALVLLADDTVGTVMGEGQCRGFWRRSRQCDHLRSVGGREQRQLPDGVACREGLVSEGNRRERRNFSARGHEFADRTANAWPRRG